MANWGFGNTSFNSSPPQEAPSTFSPFPVWDASIQQTPSTIDANSIGVGSASLARKQISPEEFVQVGSGKHWSTGAIATKKTVPTVPELTSAAEAAALEAQKKANLHNIEEEISGQNLYKTELCRSFEETGACRYGSKCQFAHGRDELRPVLRHPKYKTEVCKTFHTIGTCPYGKRCRFIHGTPPAERKQPTSPTSHPINQVNESKQNAMLNSWSSQWPGQQKQQPQQQQQQQQQQSPQLNTSPKQSNQYVNSPGVFQSSFSTPSPQVMTQKKPQSENWARSMRAPSLQAVPRNSYGKINDANVTSYFNAPFTPSATIKPTLSRSDPTGHPSYNREMLNNGPPTIFVPRAITTSAEAFTPISNNTVVTPKEYYSNSGGEQQAPTIATSSSANNSPNNSSEESSRRLSFFNNLCEPPRNNFHLTR